MTTMTPIANSVDVAYFGPARRSLLGCYHLPEPPLRDRAVLLCYPFAHEYVRSQRALRLLGDRLARLGIPTFRFDFLGTGDSALESDEVGFPTVGTRTAELKRTGLAAFGTSLKILGTCLKEAPEFAQRRRMKSSSGR